MFSLFLLLSSLIHHAWIWKKNTFLILPRTFFSWITNAEDTRKTSVFLHRPAGRRRSGMTWTVGVCFFLFLLFSFFFFVFDGCGHISCSAVNRSPISENHCSVFGYRSPIRPKWHRSPIINRSAILPIPIPRGDFIATAPPLPYPRPAPHVGHREGRGGGGGV